MKRRDFIKRGALFVPAIFVPRLIRAQSILTAEGLAAFGTNAPTGGGGGAPCTASYANTGGTGNRTNAGDNSVFVSGDWFGGGVQKTIDGDTTNAGQFFFSGAAVANTSIIFDFDGGTGRQVLITEVKYYQGDATDQGVWKFQGSNDASSWTDIGGSFSLVTAATTTITAMSGNTTKYRYYRFYGVSGTSNGGPWCFEFEFKIC